MRVLDDHAATVSTEVERHEGSTVKSTGDGFLITFDGPARAIRCARAVLDMSSERGLQVRAGLHTGECEVLGDDIGGIAVHIAARVSALAGAGEVLVSRTVKDLVAGSGLEFQERGSHELKGVPDVWELYAAP
jgi:class 3 adenylate cyclase